MNKKVLHRRRDSSKIWEIKSKLTSSETIWNMAQQKLYNGNRSQGKMC